jgi:myo-inositol catabolism protein IolS
MKYRTLGRTDIRVSVICHGLWSISPEDWMWGGNPREESLSAIRASLEEGVNFFDTAEAYGEGGSEEVLGEALAGRRQEAVIATKVSSAHLAPADLKKSFEASLRRLRTDYIDLYQIHWPGRDVPLADTLGAMEELRVQGKLRVVGVSNFGVGPMRNLFSAGRAETNQLAYSLLWRPIERDILPICTEHEVGVLCYSPLCQSLLTGKFARPDEVPPRRARNRLFSKDRPHSRHGEGGCEKEVFEALARIREVCGHAGLSMDQAALAWLVARPGVTAAIPGARTAEQAQRNARAADAGLSSQVIAELDSATQPVKARLGTNADMWESTSRMEP